MTRTIVIIASLLICLQGFSQKQPAIDYNSNKLATFQGGDLNTFRNWVKAQVNYKPKEVDLLKGTRGYIEFLIDTTGQVFKVKILKTSGDTHLDTLVMQAIKTSPKWSPSIRGGKPVIQSFTISPISTLLQ